MTPNCFVTQLFSILSVQQNSKHKHNCSVKQTQLINVHRVSRSLNSFL